MFFMGEAWAKPDLSFRILQCIAHNVSPTLLNIDSQPSTARDIKFRSCAPFINVPR